MFGFSGKDLHIYVEQQKIKKVKSFLKRHKGNYEMLNYKDESGRTALHKATDLLMIQTLGEFLDLEAIDNNGETPLHHHIYTNEQAVQLLLDLGANPSPSSNRNLGGIRLAERIFKTTPLGLALEDKLPKIADILLKAGAKTLDSFFIDEEIFFAEVENSTIGDCNNFDDPVINFDDICAEDKDVTITQDDIEALFALDYDPLSSEEDKTPDQNIADLLNEMADSDLSEEAQNFLNFVEKTDPKNLSKEEGIKGAFIVAAYLTKEALNIEVEQDPEVKDAFENLEQLLTNKLPAPSQ